MKLCAPLRRTGNVVLRAAMRGVLPAVLASLGACCLLAFSPACSRRASAPAAPAAASPAPAEPPAATPAPAPAAEPVRDADQYFKVIEPHLDRVNIYGTPQQFLSDLENTPERARHLLTAHWCVSEVSNGGFQQFFAGAAGVMGPEAVAGLRALGLTENATVLERAMAMLGAKYPREMPRRNQLLKRLASTGKPRPGVKSGAGADPESSPFTTLDEQFLQALQARPGGFDATAAAYARAGS